ncbi:Glycerol-1-phosphate phosphohydrolase 2 [Pseudocercospora fuligena]|uniref:Glycerol-1-phosphate phosphohydrolase 2 n=1 Tax=Pseudocercospora fuligena TaxID=685502 RepID=A0A8H6VFG6_9PEZI|nr:Glycerol-1-phosphate phosphohydrolase 2 [Pseudocercospora fuligena]
MPHHEENQNFSSPPESHSFSALLFDMDGTIIDSTDAIIKHWHQIGKEIGVDGDEILKTSHGRRSIDVLAILCPERANWEYVCKAEGVIPKLYGNDAVEIPGARKFLEKLEGLGVVSWAIVTSGTKPLVMGWLERMKLAVPKFMVTAEEVQHGKPNPEPYLEGARRLGKSGKEDVLVFEDAPSGVRAGKAAGFKVLALATTHEVEELREAGADWIVRDLRSVRVERFDGKSGIVTVEIRDALVVRAEGGAGSME